MMLVTCNAQGELTALERGLHALHRPEGMDVKGYAASAGRENQYRNVVNEVYAAEVAALVENVFNASLSPHYMKLVEIHAAPAWLWPALVAAMLPNARTAVHRRCPVSTMSVSRLPQFEHTRRSRQSSTETSAP
jgi:hypothetical protein